MGIAPLLVVLLIFEQGKSDRLPQIRKDKDHNPPGQYLELDDIDEDGSIDTLSYHDDSSLLEGAKHSGNGGGGGGNGAKDRFVGLFPTSEHTDLIFNNLQCGSESSFKKICTSACSSLLITEFGYCGEHINFTRRHFDMDQITVTLGCIFDFHYAIKFKHAVDKKKVNDVQVNYTLAIVDSNYTLQYLFFFNDIKPLAFDWVMHGHHNVLEPWDGLKKELARQSITFDEYRQPKPEIWRVILYEFVDRGIFPFRKPVPPFILDKDLPLSPIRASIVATGFYCVSFYG